MNNSLTDWEGSMPRDFMETATPPHLALCISSMWFLSCIFYLKKKQNKTVIVKSFLWFCESLHQIIRPEEAVVGTLKFVVKWDRSVQVAWDQRLETGSWSKDGLPKLTSGSVRIGLSRTPSWCHEKRHPTFAITSDIRKDHTIVCIFFHWGQITSSLKVRLSHPLQYLS